MKRGRAASQLGTSGSCRTRTNVMAMRSPELTIDATGTPVWADTQAKQVAPDGSRSTCICTACAQTASRMSITNTVEAHCLQRRSKLAGVCVMDDNQ